MPSPVGTTPASPMDSVDCRRAEPAPGLPGLASLIRRTTRVGALAGAMLAPVIARAQASAEPSLSALPVLRVVDTAYVDTSAHACTDFFQFANGRWLAHDTIPAAYPYSGVARDMADRNELVVRSVLDDAAARRDSVSANATSRKLGTFYATCMDSTAAESQGVTPLAPLLQQIARVTTRASLMPEIAALQVDGVNALFQYGAGSDPHHADRYMAWLQQGGLGLPDRDYYTRRGSAADSIRQRYLAHIAHLLALAGEDPGAARADARHVLRLEAALARASLTRVALREPAATDHPTSVPAFRSLAPAVDWPMYAQTIGLTAPIVRVNVAEPAYFRRVDSLLRAAPLADWRPYLRYHTLAMAAPWLSTPFVQEDFAFSRLFSGATAILPRWKRCERGADREMGEALGEAFVAKTFPPEARARARAVIDHILATFRERLLHLTWMSDSTKSQAVGKLDRVHEKVGYPDHWRDYSRLEITDGPFVTNVIGANTFEWHRVVNRPGTPVDTTEWDMTVPTVNAYYDPPKNGDGVPGRSAGPANVRSLS